MITRPPFFLLAAAMLASTATAMAAKSVDSQAVVPLPANPTSHELVVAKPVLIEGAKLSETPTIFAILPIQSQIPQPAIMRNYYLTAQAKKAVLPFWQGPRPLRLRNPFLAGSEK